MALSPPPPLPTRRRSSIRRRILLFLRVGVLVAGILVTAFYLEEDWCGARAWAACQSELQAKGESLDWKTFIPPPVPDEQNLAMAPLFVRSLHYRTDPKTGAYTFSHPPEFPEDLKDMPYAGTGPQDRTLSGWRTAKPTDFLSYQRYYQKTDGFAHPAQPQSPPEDVLLALSRYAPALDELAQAAAARPLTRFPVDWGREDLFSTLRLPHYSIEQQIATTLGLRASARLAAGSAEDALRDLELALRLSHDMHADPLWIAHVVRITCLRLALDPIWEGLADRRWSAAELTRLQANLQRFDLMDDYSASLRSERAYFLEGIDYWKKRRDPSFLLTTNAFDPKLSDGFKSFVRVAGFLIPQGWYDLNKAIIARFDQAYSEAIDPKGHRFLVVINRLLPA